MAPDFLALMKYEHKKRFGVVAAALREVLSLAPEPDRYGEAYVVSLIYGD